MTVGYGSWFVPHLLLAYLLTRHNAYVSRAGARLSAAYHLTTPFHWVAPEAPPWWASEQEGRMAARSSASRGWSSATCSSVSRRRRVPGPATRGLLVADAVPRAEPLAAPFVRAVARAVD